MPDRQQARLGDHPLAEDLSDVLAHTAPLWAELQGLSIFVTGGTGFFGTWLLESFAWANARMKLNAAALVLTRDPDAFKRTAPHLAADPAIRFHQGDVRDFRFPQGEFSHIIHGAASSATATFNNEDQLVKFDTIVQGTRRTLDFAKQCGAKKFLFTSSGAVYGVQPPTMEHVPEDYAGAPDSTSPSAAWGEGKRAAEFLCAYYSQQYGFEAKIARCFSFVGPHLPLAIHYAIGNFMADGLKGGPIKVKGTGTPCRSYLHAVDLVIWLWTILFKGQANRAYNVGSDEAISIAGLAQEVARCFPQAPAVEIAGAPSSSSTGTAVDRYVPSTQRAEQELGLKRTIDLHEAIRRTVAFIQRTSAAKSTP